MKFKRNPRVVEKWYEVQVKLHVGGIFLYKCSTKADARKATRQAKEAYPNSTITASKHIKKVIPL